MILATAGLVIVVRDWWVRKQEAKKNRCYTMRLLIGVKQEVERGFRRCNSITNQMAKGNVSYSRIYTSFYETVKADLIRHIKDFEIITLLEWFYHRFELVNMNMDKGSPEEDLFVKIDVDGQEQFISAPKVGPYMTGAAWAKDGLPEMGKNYPVLLEKITNSILSIYIEGEMRGTWNKLQRFIPIKFRIYLKI